MKAESHSSTIAAILRQKCPRCRSGAIFRSSIFRGIAKMNEHCPVCDLKFEREEGYFLGAMYISYGLALIFIIGLAGLLWDLLPWSIQKAVIWAVLLFLPAAPLIALFSRVLWIYWTRRLILHHTRDLQLTPRTMTKQENHVTKSIIRAGLVSAHDSVTD